jgi:hypothetical protein
MHDLDRQMLEQYEHEGIFGEAGAELSETQELALASEFLEIASEEELEQFLGDLWNRTKAAASQVYNSSAVQSAIPALKAAGRGFLPIAAGKLSDRYFPGSGGMVQAGVQGLADQLLKEQLEGLSAEDRELAVARRYVRFALDALDRAAQAPERVPPQVAGQVAIRDAARQHIPGLVPLLPRLDPASQNGGGPGAGRWVRQGSSIVVELG